MIINISALAVMVRRMDESATLKSFVVVLAVLFVLANLENLKNFMQWELLDEIFGNRGLVIAWVVAAFIGAFGPLGFIIWDWVARQPWRHLAAISGALIGGVASALLGAALGAFGANLVDEIDSYTLPEWSALFAVNGLVVAALIGWTNSESGRVRNIAGWTLIIFGACVLAGLSIAILASEIGEPEYTWEYFVELAATVVGLAAWVAGMMLVVWLVVRAVRHRIVLSGDRPRELLLGAIHRKSLWARLAFLAGLPSSLWHLRAIPKPPFWAFLLARPLVYAGVLLLVGKISAGLDLGGTIALGSGGIVGGHVLFWTAKRLAARYVWDPTHALDSRPPVLFLRSFEDDQLRFNRSRWNLVGRWFDLWSFRRNADEAMIDEIAQYGPVVALGMPGETRIPFGAMRYYSEHEDWKKIVTDTAKRAQAIVIGAGDSPGVLWEYEMLAREDLLDRTVLLFPAATADHDSKNARALETFVKATGTGPGAEPPSNDHVIALLTTDAGPTLLTADAPTAAAYVLALRAYFQKCTSRHLADPLVLADCTGIGPVASKNG